MGSLFIFLFRRRKKKYYRDCTQKDKSAVRSGYCMAAGVMPLSDPPSMDHFAAKLPGSFAGEEYDEACRVLREP